jgi:hypothetical protein
MKGTMPKLHPVAFYSATFTPTQQKYDIYEKELLAVVKSLEHWRAYLAWGKHQFIVLTDHANLTFWKHPCKLNDRTARWHAKLQDYDFKIHHIKGKVNSAADALSRADDMEKCKEREPTIVIPAHSFLNQVSLDSNTIITRVRESQKCFPLIEKEDQEKETHQRVIDLDGGTTLRKRKSNEAIIPSNDEELKRYLMEIHHDHPTARHPGRDKSLKILKTHYYWPQMSKWIKQYIQGCATCQESKILTHRPKTSLYKILVPE